MEPLSGKADEVIAYETHNARLSYALHIYEPVIDRIRRDFSTTNVFADMYRLRERWDRLNAESLYEAVALALPIFRQHDCAPGPASRIEVEVLSPSVRHTLTLSKLKEWLDGGSNSPQQIALKKRLRALVESKS
jgi:hypothetical protein